MSVLAGRRRAFQRAKAGLFAMPWRGFWSSRVWITRATTLTWWRPLVRRFRIVSLAYVALAALVGGYWLINNGFSNVPSPAWSAFDAQVIEVMGTFLLTWGIWAALLYVVYLGTLLYKRDDISTDLKDFDPIVTYSRRKPVVTEARVTSKVWEGRVKYTWGTRFAWKGGKWPPHCLLKVMESEEPLVAPDGSGVWFDEDSGHSVVLANDGVIRWIEKRDLRPDLERYLRLVDEPINSVTFRPGTTHREASP